MVPHRRPRPPRRRRHPAPDRTHRLPGQGPRSRRQHRRDRTRPPGPPRRPQAGVAAQPDPIAGKKLLAGVHRAPGTTLTALQLRTHCARHLPRAAVPHQLTVTDEPLPKTATGKVDRKALHTLVTPSTTTHAPVPAAAPLAEGIPS
ncbi:AMP-binding enzyme [Streptomyces manipurensis]|uniref:AMP-binding enzyme n=1 Tax=Streptomyces manipurensis TaxID=1077945 RepID=UPI003C7005E2